MPVHFGDVFLNPHTLQKQTINPPDTEPNPPDTEPNGVIPSIRVPWAPEVHPSPVAVTVT